MRGEDDDTARLATRALEVLRMLSIVAKKQMTDAFSGCRR